MFEKICNMLQMIIVYISDFNRLTAGDIHVIKGTANEASMPKDEERKGVPLNVQFALMLSSQFSGLTQVHACCQLMEYIINLPEEKGRK